MDVSRRNILAIMAGVATNSSKLERPIGRLASNNSDNTVLPHNPEPIPRKLPQSRLVFGFWHLFPLSFDNKPFNEDYYARGFLDPNGEKGKHLDYGGFIRDRPLPQRQILDADWRIESAYQDILYAQNSGINSFIFNVSSIVTKSGYFVDADSLYRAIEKYDMSFRIAPCLDLATLSMSQSAEEIAGFFLLMLKRTGALIMPDGRPLLVAFAADVWAPARWSEILTALERAGVRVCFLPIFLDSKRTTEAHFDLADIIGWWSGNFPASAIAMRDKADAARRRGKAFMWSVWPQDCRPKVNWYAEARNSETFRLGWENAIDSNVDFVCVNTWNDYSESSQIRPSIGIQYSFSDLNKFYSDWFQTRRKPKVIRDVIYYFHRKEFTYQVPNPAGTRRLMENRLGPTPVNDIEVVCYLVASGIVEVRNLRGITQFLAQAGMSSFRTPLTTGIQHIKLIRNGKVLKSFVSDFTVEESHGWQDLTYKGGSSSRIRSVNGRL